jgi:hypothetical protein
VRIWDRIPPDSLCRSHLLGEHRELHGLWNILVRVESGEDPSKIGYAAHPETRRWFGHRRALYDRHEVLVAEMLARGYNHQSPLEAGPGTATGDGADKPAEIDDQRAILSAKGCDCRP